MQKLILTVVATAMLTLGAAASATPAYSVNWLVAPDGLHITYLANGQQVQLYEVPNDCGGSGEDYTYVNTMLMTTGNPTSVTATVVKACPNGDVMVKFATPYGTSYANYATKQHLVLPSFPITWTLNLDGMTLSVLRASNTNRIYQTSRSCGPHGQAYQDIRDLLKKSGDQQIFVKFLTNCPNGNVNIEFVTPYGTANAVYSTKR